jgi:2-oxoglutarate dehydrogenase E1 component
VPADEGLNAGYALVLYANYLADPASVDPSWRAYFEANGPPVDGRFAGTLVLAKAPAAVPEGGGPPTGPAPQVAPADVAAAMELVRAYRDFGHLAAHLDPLGSEPPGDPSLDPAAHGLDAQTMAAVPAAILGLALPEAQVTDATLADVLPALRATYAGVIAYEVGHIASHRERAWLRGQIETGAHRTPLDAEEQRRLLGRLTEVEALEHFLGRAYLGQKRFSIEGLDVLVPMLDLVVESAADDGVREVVLGMAHRGRLNVLAHIVGIGYEAILEEFEAGADIEQGRIPKGPTDDVKYHHGARGAYRRRAGDEVAITIVPNPSHLEAVDPVVEGRVRALQTDRGITGPARHEPTGALATLVHGDAAFAAQGVVAETFNLARLPGYTTGGTVHLIANNQIGFTTGVREARSTDFASDLAKGFDVPIVHVNADDPEACLAAIRLAMAYRHEFGGDVVVDVVGYRRYGHNEGDEPAYTQPLAAERIKVTPSVRERYLERLVAAGVVDTAAADKLREAAFQRLDAARERVRDGDARRWAEAPERDSDGAAEEPETAVEHDLLARLDGELLRVPDGFTVHPKLATQLGRREAAFESSGRVDWGLSEGLAFATLLGQGVPVRITGQDTERGTFSQRHLAFFDARTDQRYAPLEHLEGGRAAIEIHNSPLSEFACLGFEYGYSVAAPEGLVAWEAQYGDFVNEAEVVVDQFIVAGRAKWGEASRLTLLLPHGFEGQGPEHSSARLERFLALSANGNLRVAVPTTAAQYFHLLRRQALHVERRPLIVMTPKSLLRLPEASSTADELSAGRFQPVIAPAKEDLAAVRRLVLCSGKIYYDLARSDLAAGPEVAVARVELLYPFPTDQLETLLDRLPALETVVWAQEEPRNMGALKFVLPELGRIAPDTVALETVARPERASPAEGYGAAHLAEQRRLVREALRPRGKAKERSGSRDVSWR